MSSTHSAVNKQVRETLTSPCRPRDDRIDCIQCFLTNCGLCLIHRAPTFGGSRHIKGGRMLTVERIDNLYLRLLRHSTRLDAVHEISSVGFEFVPRYRLKEMFMPLPSGLRIDHEFISLPFNNWQPCADQSEKVSLRPKRNQQTRMRATILDPLRKRCRNSRSKGDRFTHTPEISGSFRRDLGHRNLRNSSQQCFPVSFSVILEVSPHHRFLVLWHHKAVAQQPQSLAAFVSKNPHQLKQLLLALCLHQLRMTYRKIAGRHDREDRSNRLDPVGCITPLTRNTPSPSNQANQANEWDGKCQEHRTLFESITHHAASLLLLGDSLSRRPLYFNLRAAA